MASVPTASKGRAYGKSSTDGFTGGRTASNPKRGSSDRPLGPQIVVDGNFYDPLKWIIGAEWTIGFGFASATAGLVTAIEQTPPILLIDGDDYQVDIIVSGAGAGTVTVDFTGGTPVASASLGNGTARFDLTADAGNTGIAVTKDIAFDGDIEFLSIRHVDPV